VNIGILYILSISSLGVYGIMLGGWASNSKYPCSARSGARRRWFPTRLPLGLAIIGPLLLAGTASMTGIVRAQESQGVWFVFPQIVALFCYFISGMAETNRIPFDSSRAEAEARRRIFHEYSGMKFAFFYLAEYTNMIVVSSIATTLWLGGCSGRSRACRRCPSSISSISSARPSPGYSGSDSRSSWSSSSTSGSAGRFPGTATTSS